MPRPYSVSSQAVMEKKRKHLLTKNKTEDVVKKEDIHTPVLGGNLEGSSVWSVFLEEAVQEAEVRRKDRAADWPPSALVLGLLAGEGWSLAGRIQEMTSQDRACGALTKGRPSSPGPSGSAR